MLSLVPNLVIITSGPLTVVGDLLKQISDTAAIESMVEKILADNTKQVEAYRGGKTKLQGFFVGQVLYSDNNHAFPSNFAACHSHNR